METGNKGAEEKNINQLQHIYSIYSLYPLKNKRKQTPQKHVLSLSMKKKIWEQ